MVNVIANFFRLLRIFIILLFSGMLFSLIRVKLSYSDPIKREENLRRLGKQLNATLQRMGPTFIKLGQALSTRADIIGESLSNSLTDLQDKIPPFAFKVVKKSVEKEFKKPLLNLYKEFNKEPIAAASIAQVHKAITKTGEEVAVKVLRPNIEKMFVRDIKLFYFIIKFINYFFPHLKRFKLSQVIDTLANMIRIETDLRLEAASADQLRHNCADDENVYIPKIYWELTSRRVLTQEWLNGIPIYEKEKLIDAGFDLHELARKLAITFFNQAYRDGFFHADIHPGNILIGKGGKVILIDFGIMGSLEHEDRIFVAKILHGFITRDYKLVSDVHFELGYVPKTQSRELFTLACRSIGEPIIGMPVNKISIGKLLKQLFDVSQQFDMNIQPKFLLLQKTLVTVEGTGFLLYPEVNMWKLAEPWIQNWAKENFGFRAKVKEVKADIKHFAQSLPNLIDRLTNALEKIESNNLNCLTPQVNQEPKSKLNFNEIIAIFALSILAIILLKTF